MPMNFSLPVTHHTKMAHATSTGENRPSQNSPSSRRTDLRQELTDRMRRVRALPQKLMVAAFVYPIALFWAAIVLLKESLVFLKAPLKYFQVESRPYPDALRPSNERLHKRAHLSNGTILHYVEQGDASKPMMLFIHGFPEFWYSWRHQLSALSSQYYCVAIDMRGYGDSSKPDGKENYLAADLLQDFSLLLDFLGKPKCTMVGHDWGGALAWMFAALHPNKLDRLVIMNCPNPDSYSAHMDLKQFLHSWYIFFFQLPCLPELTMWHSDVSSLDRMFISTNLTPAEMDAYKYTFAQPRAFEFPINYYRANMQSRLAKSLCKCGSAAAAVPRKIPATVPVLTIWGEGDLYLNKEYAKFSGEACENYRYIYVNNAGHFVQQERPAEVNTLLEQFMRTDDVSEPSGR